MAYLKDGMFILAVCSTLNMDEERVKEFKRLTKARMITGYRKDVDFIESFVFELWLLNVIANHPEYGPDRIKDIAEKRWDIMLKNLSLNRSDIIAE